jgi:hypothetical protein
MYSALARRIRDDNQEKGRHERILRRGTFSSTVAFKILNHGRGVFAEVTKVYCFTTSAKNEQTIKYLKEFRRRLMNSNRKQVSESG